MISNKILDKIRSKLLNYGERRKGVFDNGEIEELFRGYEKLLLKYNGLLARHDEQRRVAMQYADEKQDRARRAHERDMSMMM